jgi:hypothetical protein
LRFDLERHPRASTHQLLERVSQHDRPKPHSFRWLSELVYSSERV